MALWEWKGDGRRIMTESNDDKLIRKKWRKIHWSSEDWKDFYYTIKQFKLRIIRRHDELGRKKLHSTLPEQ